MKWHLDHTPENNGLFINHADRILLIGSCFSENIGEKFRAGRFRSLVNPSGNLFNPWSIAETLKNAIGFHSEHPPQFVERSGTWLSYRHHSRVNAPSPDILEAIIGAVQKETAEFLKNASVLIITFGSAHLYELKSTGLPVANCHKQPQQLFTKRRMDLDEIVSLYTDLLFRLKEFNPDLKVLFTVSPVKYLRDGVTADNLSKATLLLATEQICRQSSSYYFPSYELVVDDLRDYRFYKQDLAHPNEQAIEYVWQKFADCYFSDHTRNCISELEKLNSAMQHRSIHQNPEEISKLKSFVDRQKNIIAAMEPSIEF